MGKVNKKIILMLFLVLIMGISVGCRKTQNAPEGVSQEFYDDMVNISEKLIKTVKNAKNTSIENSDILKDDGYGKIVQYIEDSDLTLIEYTIANTLEDIYFKVAMYHDGIPLEEDIKELVQSFSELMNMEFEANKILLK